MKAGDKLKTQIVALRVTPEEHAQLKARAAKAGMNMSRYLSAAAFDKEIIVLDVTLLKSLLKEMEKIKTNLSQLMILCLKGQINNMDICSNLSDVEEFQQKLHAEIFRLQDMVDQKYAK